MVTTNGIEVTSVQVVSQQFQAGERVAWVDANNRLRYGVVAQRRSQPGRVSIKDETGYFMAEPEVERVAHLD